MSEHKPRVVIIGGGFGGLNAARGLRKADVEVVLIDRHNYHLFQPLLYQVATAGLSPADIASPIRSVLERQKNARVLLGEVDRVDRQNRKVHLRDGEVDYDYLIIAAGMQNNYFGNDDWAERAPGLKSIDEALDLRRKMLLAFEAAEYEEDPEELERLLTFVVIGGGPTGVEMAGAIAEIAREVIHSDFRNIDPSHSRIVLVEGLDRLLMAFSEESGQKAKEQLEKRGVEVILETFVEDITEEGVRAGGRLIPAKNVIWGAGLKAESLADSLELEQDRAGCLHVHPDLTVRGDDRIYAIGDIAHFEVEPEEEGEEAEELPGMAPVAIQQGQHVAKNLRRRLEGKDQEPFEYFDKGAMATIGRAAAVAEVGNWKFGGFFAWLVWLFVHLIFLVGFQNKLSVLLNWFYSYVAFRRSTRLIVGAEADGFGRKLLREAPSKLEGAAALDVEEQREQELEREAAEATAQQEEPEEETVAA